MAICLGTNTKDLQCLKNEYNIIYEEPRSEEEITVDGIRYNIAKGKVVEDENLQQHARGLDSIRGQHQVTAESAGQKMR